MRYSIAMARTGELDPEHFTGSAANVKRLSPTSPKLQRFSNTRKPRSCPSSRRCSISGVSCPAGQGSACQVRYRAFGSAPDNRRPPADNREVAHIPVKSPDLVPPGVKSRNRLALPFPCIFNMQMPMQPPGPTPRRLSQARCPQKLISKSPAWPPPGEHARARRHACRCAVELNRGFTKPSASQVRTGKICACRRRGRPAFRGYCMCQVDYFHGFPQLRLILIIIYGFNIPVNIFGQQSQFFTQHCWLITQQAKYY